MSTEAGSLLSTFIFCFHGRHLLLLPLHDFWEKGASDDYHDESYAKSLPSTPKKTDLFQSYQIFLPQIAKKLLKMPKCEFGQKKTHTLAIWPKITVNFGKLAEK